MAFLALVATINFLLEARTVVFADGLVVVLTTSFGGFTVGLLATN